MQPVGEGQCPEFPPQGAAGWKIPDSEKWLVLATQGCGVRSEQREGPRGLGLQHEDARAKYTWGDGPTLTSNRLEVSLIK